MVQPVYHYFDSNSRCFINTTKHSELNVSTKYRSPNNSAEPSKLRGIKKQCIRLQPMNAKVENTSDVGLNANERKSLYKVNQPPNKPIDVTTQKKLSSKNAKVENTSDVGLNANERKSLYKVNQPPNKPIDVTTQKKLRSKIPLLKRKTDVSPNQKNNDVYWEASLSAADRRQKFYESRQTCHRATGICIACINEESSKIYKEMLTALKDPNIRKELTALQFDAVESEHYCVKKIENSSVHDVNQKTTLPPIKPVETIEKINQPKSKSTGICIACINEESSKIYKEMLTALKDPNIRKELTALQFDAVESEHYCVKKIENSSVHDVNQKTTLPPIKPVETIEKINQPKSKCLSGEITHFPALVARPLPLCARKKNFSSTIPNLPPILPPPAAPPPSISTSFEKDGKKVKHYNRNNKLNEEWNYTSAFPKIFPF